jgi:hypothetical protein
MVVGSLSYSASDAYVSPGIAPPLPFFALKINNIALILAPLLTPKSYLKTIPLSVSNFFYREMSLT